MSNYDVGYGKPPKKSQFKKGSSGNPKGRPKGAKNRTSRALEMYHKQMTVMQNGKPTKLSMIDVVHAKLLASAAKGDIKAMKLAFDQYAKLLSGLASKSMVGLMLGQSPFELTAEDEANIAEFKLLEGVK